LTCRANHRHNDIIANSLTPALETAAGFLFFTDRTADASTAESIKSLEGFRIAWVDEAQTLSARSLALLRLTIRAPASELWASWNSLQLRLMRAGAVACTA
jgi:hypothetical protein